MSLLSIENLNLSYPIEGGPPLTILQSLSLSIEKGEMTAIQGPSGSGKSTLLYLIGGLLKPSGGHIYLDEEDITSWSNDALAIYRNKKIGFIFQQFHLLPRTSVLQNILLPTQYPSEYALDIPALREKATSLANRFGIGERLDHLPNQLSGGQQQRVAIARALMKDPEILLADEPTGNLDSKSSAQIMDLLKELNAQGKTILVITHDSEIAKQCKRVIHIRDGRIVDDSAPPRTSMLTVAKTEEHKSYCDVSPSKRKNLSAYLAIAKAAAPLAWKNLGRNKIRTALTMLGITIGISAVLAMMTLGQYTKEKILASYTELGANTFNLYGYPNWNLKATDQVPSVFRAFSWEKDLSHLKRVFPQIQRLSPTLRGWDGKVAFSGKLVESDVRVMGLNEDAVPLMNRTILMGKNFSPFHIENKNSVCLLGYEVAKRLFVGLNPIGQVIYASQNDTSFSCKVIGVLATTSSKSEWSKPDFQVIIPFTLYRTIFGEGRWNTEIHDALFQVHDAQAVEKTSKAIKAFFQMKYGKSGRFTVDSNSLLLAQMNKFLTLFSILLTAIALVSLTVGGIGITNMMLVSVSERFREVGLRKALGATNTDIRIQFMLESIIICCIAGALGLFLGFASYELALFAASKLIPKLPFEWVVHWSALLLSVGSIFIVGFISGLFPALKAEKLQVMEALRSE